MKLGLFIGCLWGSSLLFGTSYAEKQWPDFIYAENIEVTHFSGYRLFSIKNTYRNSKEHYQIALVPKSNVEPLPKVHEDALIVRTPVERVVPLTTTFVGFIDALNQQDKLVAVSDPQYINDPKIQTAVADGEIRKVQTGARLDIEQMLLIQPDLILTTTIGEGSYEVQPQLARAGLPVALSAEYTEASPLARAEWIKFVAAFFEADVEAERIFEEISQQYQALQAMTAGVTERPTVFSGAPYSGAWYVPGGQSYIAQFIKDAGGDYIWQSDPTTGAIPLDLERVFRKAGMAEIWIDPSSYKSRDQMIGADKRLAKFKAFQEDRVYNNTRQMPAMGGNNIWERGIVHPEEVLADMIHLFHPALLPDHELVYYEHLR